MLALSSTDCRSQPDCAACWYLGSSLMASTTIPEGRLDIVEELWRRCVPNSKIEASLSAQWSVTRRTIRSYIAKIVRRNGNLRKSAEHDEAHQRAEYERTLAMFEDIYLSAKEGEGEKGKGKDLRTALNAVHRRAQLLGLYPANRFEVTGANGNPLEVSPADAVKKLLDQLDNVAAREAGGEKKA